MDANLFLEQFGHLAESANGVQKLRNIILDLAVRGKLVPQNPNDEPASELLRQIRKEGQRLVEVSEIKNLEMPLSIEITTELPESWRWVRISDIAQVRGGKRIPAGHSLLDIPTQYIYIRVTDMKNGTINSSDLKYLSADTRELISSYTISSEDIYITIAGTIGSVGFVPKELSGMNLTENAAKITLFSNNLLDRRYLYFVLSSETLQSQFTEKFNQLAQPKLSLRSIRNSFIPLSPLAEQHRIVAKVDELMQICDQLEAQQAQRDHLQEHATKSTLYHLTNASSKAEVLNYWQHTERHFHELFDRVSTVADLRAAILELAVHGRLVPQNPDDEPASELLKRIDKEKEKFVRAGELKKFEKLPPIGDDEKNYDLPSGWEWAALGQCVLRTSSGWSPQCLPRPAETDEWGVLKVSAVSWDKFNPLENKALPSGIEPREEFAVKENDFLISRANTDELVGKAVIVENDYPKLLLSDKIVNVIFASQLNLHYMLLIVNSNTTRNYYKKVASGTSSSMKNISRQHISNIPCPLAPLTEQHRIVAKVDELMQLCDRLEQKATNKRDLSAKLLDSVINHLFDPAIAT